MAPPPRHCACGRGALSWLPWPLARRPRRSCRSAPTAQARRHAACARTSSQRWRCTTCCARSRFAWTSSRSKRPHAARPASCPRTCACSCRSSSKARLAPRRPPRPPRSPPERAGAGCRSNARTRAELARRPGGRGCPTRGYWQTAPAVDAPRGSTAALPAAGPFEVEFLATVLGLAELISAGARVLVDVYHQDR